ncbi:unnamed protein product [Rotaria sp. Silwood2]|nr:unnamed protein product [Rotaria sp. Silwood2]CAF3249398.1 unnamed protein product [Rotaria sp. Silwood2]CAF4650411.1 unnamed protein product [Rotaria sp. Silwood2]
MESKELNSTSTDRIVINVPYVGRTTQQLSKDIKKIAKEIKPTTQVTIVQRPPIAPRQMFQNKDKIPKNLQSNIIYEINCSSCSASYIGKTVRQACRRLKEHGAPTEALIESNNENLRRSQRIAKLNAKNKVPISYYESDSGEDDDLPRTPYTSAIKRHMTCTKHKIDWKNWNILDKDKHPYRLLVKESLAINAKSPTLNLTTRSVPLVVYPEGRINKKRNQEFCQQHQAIQH